MLGITLFVAMLGLVIGMIQHPWIAVALCATYIAVVISLFAYFLITDQ